MTTHVDPDRLRDTTLALVDIPSPTGDTAEVAHAYAALLKEVGMEVEVLTEPFPKTPIVIGTLKGDRPGPRFVFSGHLDTVPIDHAPPYVDGDRIYGRGSTAMKGPCACAAEAVRVIHSSGQSFSGEIVIVAIGLHEAPGGRGEDLTWLLHEHGFTADMAVVCELSAHNVAVAHMGQATVEITVSRPGEATHELRTPAGTPNPIHGAARVVDAVKARNEELSATTYPWVGPETYFIGEIHGGDFYNRFPNSCRIVGTRRWAPGNTIEAVRAEYDALLARVAEETGLDITLDLKLVRGAYSIDENAPLLKALQAAYKDVTGDELKPVGIKTVADGALFSAAGIPTVYHGPFGEGAHGDVEYITVGELVRATEVYLAMLRKLL